MNRSVSVRKFGGSSFVTRQGYQAMASTLFSSGFLVDHEAGFQPTTGAALSLGIGTFAGGGALAAASFA